MRTYRARIGVLTPAGEVDSIKVISIEAMGHAMAQAFAWWQAEAMGRGIAFVMSCEPMTPPACTVKESAHV